MSIRLLTTLRSSFWVRTTVGLRMLRMRSCSSFDAGLGSRSRISPVGWSRFGNVALRHVTDTFIAGIERESRRGLLAAWRYLAYLDEERRFLLHEIKPDWRKTGYMVPSDRQVNGLNLPGPGGYGDPITRAPEVLRFLGIDPFEDDAWVGMIGVDISQIPIIGPVPKKRQR